MARARRHPAETHKLALHRPRPPTFHVATENKVALVDENLFPVVVNERFRCICTGCNLDEAGPISAPPGLIEVA